MAERHSWSWPGVGTGPLGRQDQYKPFTPLSLVLGGQLRLCLNKVHYFTVQ